MDNFLNDHPDTENSISLHLNAKLRKLAVSIFKDSILLAFIWVQVQLFN